MAAKAERPKNKNKATQSLRMTMTAQWPIGTVVGVLGGGQLARMLADSAHRLGLEFHVFCESLDEPAAQVSGNITLGKMNDTKKLVGFLAPLDVLLFESEFVDVVSLKKILSNKRLTHIRVVPDLDLMALLQDRRTQKEILQQSNLPTSAFLVVNSVHELKLAYEYFNGTFVLKKARGGYDGYGTFMVRSKKDFDRLTKNFPGPSIAEAFVPFKQELAVMAVASPTEILFLPLVFSQQTNSKCDYVVGPVTHPKWNSLSKKIAEFLALRNYQGVMGIEFFDCPRNGLLINEIAPRVHNSGHYSLSALLHSQFDLHLMAALGVELPELKLLAKSFVMTNLVGESNRDFQIPGKLEGQLWWYGKTQNRPGRKMGHVNYLGADPKQLLKTALKERERILK